MLAFSKMSVRAGAASRKSVVVRAEEGKAIAKVRPSVLDLILLLPWSPDRRANGLSLSGEGERREREERREQEGGREKRPLPLSRARAPGSGVRAAPTKRLSATRAPRAADGAVRFTPPASLAAGRSRASVLVEKKGGGGRHSLAPIPPTATEQPRSLFSPEPQNPPPKPTPRSLAHPLPISPPKPTKNKPKTNQKHKNQKHKNKKTKKQKKQVDRKAPVYPGVSSEQALTYLDGQTLPGDFGFDPLGLLDPVNSGGFVTPQWLAYSEVIHGRWAMLGAAGCLAPEVLAAAGLTPPETGVVWFRSGVIPPAGTYDGYWTDPYSLFLIEIVAMQFAELKRLQDFRFPGSQAKQNFAGLEAVFAGSGDPAYPGGQFFNLFNLGAGSAEEMKTLKLKEIKNGESFGVLSGASGTRKEKKAPRAHAPRPRPPPRQKNTGRLAMLAMLGYGAQAVMTGEGPYSNLISHLSNPTGSNILTNFASVGGSVV